MLKINRIYFLSEKDRTETRTGDLETRENFNNCQVWNLAEVVEQKMNKGGFYSQPRKAHNQQLRGKRRRI